MCYHLFIRRHSKSFKQPKTNHLINSKSTKMKTTTTTSKRKWIFRVFLSLIRLFVFKYGDKEMMMWWLWTTHSKDAQNSEWKKWKYFYVCYKTTVLGVKYTHDGFKTNGFFYYCLNDRHYLLGNSGEFMLTFCGFR